jgi:outer membrane protein
MRLALLTLLTSASVGAAAAGLGDVYQLARDNDPQYASARAAYRANVEKFEQAKALWRPSVTVTANVRSNRDYSTQLDANPRYDSSSAAVSVVQPLNHPQNLQTYAQGELQSQLASWQLRQAEQELMLRVGKAYFDVLQAQEVLASVVAQKDAFAQQLAQTRKGFQVGTVAVTEVNEAQSKYDITVAQEIAGRNDAEVKRRALARIINREPPPLARFDESRRIDVGPLDALGEMAERAGETSLGVAVALLNRELAQREVVKQDVGWVPTLDLTATARTDRNVVPQGAFLPNTSRQASIGLELSWPLYQGGALGSRQREAAANLSKAESDLDDARRQAAYDARQAYLSALSGAAQVAALEQAQSSGESQVKSTQRGFEIGVRTRLDVLNAEQQLFATRRDLSAARYQTLFAGLQLKAAAGTLAHQDLQALDAWLKP